MKNLPRNQLCRCNIPPNHRPTCSSISQQCCHPRAGHDSSGIRVNCRLAHSQRGHHQPNQHSWVYQAINRSAKPAQSKDQSLNTRSITIPSQSCEEGKDNQGKSQTKDEHRSSPQDNTELFLALTWPKQFNNNTQTRVLRQPNFTIKMVASIYRPQWIMTTLPLAMGNSMQTTIDSPKS